MFPIRPEEGLPNSTTGADVLDVIDALNSTLGRRLAVDDETVAGGLYAIAKAIEGLTAVIASSVVDAAIERRR